MLIVNNGNWTDTLVKTDYIQVSALPAAPQILDNPSAGLYLIELISGQTRVVRKVMVR